MEPQSNCTCRLKNHSPFPLKYIDVTRTTDTSLDVMSEKHIDNYWIVDGNRELSDAWTGFTRFIVLNEKPLDGYTGSGRRLTRKQMAADIEELDDCDTSNHVPLVVPGLSTSSSTPSTSPTSSSQETVTDTEIPATRSEKASEDSSARGNSWHESIEIENPSKSDDEELQSGGLQGVPDWLQEFKHGLVDERVPEHRDASISFHELPLEPRATVAPNKHNIFTHFPKDRNCDICLRTKITRASCRKRTSTVVPRA